MMLKTVSLTLAAACGLSGSAGAESLRMFEIVDPWAVMSGSDEGSGAVYMTLINQSPTDDRLIAVVSSIAGRAELQIAQTGTGSETDLSAAEEGVSIAAKTVFKLAPDTGRIALDALSAPLVAGTEIDVTLTFETAGKFYVRVPVVAADELPASGKSGD